MPRPRKPPPKPPRRRRGTGSISVNEETGEIRARPAQIGGVRANARTFAPHQMAEAVAWLDGLLHPAEIVADDTRTLEEWSSDWLDTYVAPIREATTVKTYKSHLRHLAPEYGRLLSAVRTTALQRIVGELGTTRSPGTVADIVKVWRLCFAAAVEDGLIPRNPARRLVLPTVPPAPARRYVTADEAARLRRASAETRFAAIVALILGCGLRIGEILGLHREHVHRLGRRIWVQHQFTNGHWRDLPKAHNPHWVTPPRWVWDLLAAHLETVEEVDVLVFQSPHQSRRARQDGRPRPWSEHTVRRELRRLLVAAGIEDDMTPHAGRHGLASYLMEAGVAPAVVAERLGNSAGVVIRTYGHSTDPGRELADRLLEAYADPESAGVSGDMGSDVGDSEQSVS